MEAANLGARWRQVAGDVRRSRQAAIAGASLVIVAAALLALALAGGGREVLPWAAFRLAVLGLFAVVLLTGGIRWPAAAYALTGMLVAIAVTSIGSIRPQSSVDQFTTWIAYAAVFLLASSAISGRNTDAEPLRAKRVEWARRFVDAAVFSGGALVMVALYWFWGAGTPAMRWYSTFYWPNPFAGFLLLVIPVEVLRCLLAGTRRESVAHGAMAVLLGTAFVLTFSRGAWVAGVIGAGIGAIVLRSSLDRRTAARAAVLLIVVAAAVFLLTQGQAFRSPSAGVLARATSTADLTEYSLQGRLHFWRGALEIFRDHPLRGTGPGTYAYAYPPYQRDVRYYAQDPHGIVVQMAAETGIIGLVVLLVLLAAVAAAGYRTTRGASGTPEFPWVAGVAVGLTAFWIHTGVELNWSFPAAPAMAFALMGVLAGYESLSTPAVPHEPVPRRAWGALTRVLAAAAIIAIMIVVGLQAAAFSLFRAGRGVYAARQWKAAAESFARAATFNPIDSRYPSALAAALFRAGEPLAAVLPLVRRSQALDRAHPYYWFQEALLTMRESTPEAVSATEPALRTVIALDPYHYPDAYQHLAAFYRRNGDQAAAAAVYRQAAARYPDSVATDFVLRPRLWPGVLALFMDWATFLTEQQQEGEAKALYSRIIRLEPNFVRAYMRLTELYMKEGRFAHAARVVGLGLHRAPGNRELLALRDVLRRRFPSVFR